MNLLKTSLILYPSIPGGSGYRKKTISVSNEPIVPEGASLFRKGIMVITLLGILEIISILVLKD